MLDHSCQARRHAIADRGDDFYATPPVAVEALLRVENLPLRIWEPACGDGAIVNVLRAHGHAVFATDLVDRGCPDSHSRWDFLLPTSYQYAEESECILTNPPFKLAEEFLGRALDLCPRVIFLLRLAFMESERRSWLLDQGWLARVWVFRKRLPMMHRGGWDGRKANSGMAFAWFVFDKTKTQEAIIKRLSWDR